MCFLFDCMYGNTYHFYLFHVQVDSPGSRDLTNRYFQEFLFNFNTLRGLWIVSKYGHLGFVIPRVRVL